jgi:ABC-2 type transport system permease protein
VHIPFLILLVGGDLLAGEATAGTYRMLLTRPVSRFQVITAKFIAGLVYTNLLILWMVIISFGISIAMFGKGELLVMTDKIYIFASNDVLWRFVLAYGFATLSMATVMSLSFLFSSLVENSIGPIVGSMAVIIVLIILSALPIEALKEIKRFFFTTHMTAWKEFFSEPVEKISVIKSGLFLFFHIIVFYVLSLVIFLRKDILT